MRHLIKIMKWSNKNQFACINFLIFCFFKYTAYYNQSEHKNTQQGYSFIENVWTLS